ncbi:MAG: hypothetical protein H7831_04875 [Magnetococcus sp. WYHC-3]
MVIIVRRRCREKLHVNQGIAQYSCGFVSCPDHPLYPSEATPGMKISLTQVLSFSQKKLRLTKAAGLGIQ